MHRKLLALVILLFAGIFSEAFGAKGSPFHFLRYVSNARLGGLSGAVVAMDGDAGGLFYNPASIRTVGEKKFQTTYLKHALDINSGAVSYIKDDVMDGTIAGAIAYTNYGSFDYRDAIGNADGGSFSANDIALSFSYGNDLDSNFYYGVSAKFIFVTMEKQSTVAFAVDAGLLYQMADGRTNLGLSVLHAGYQISEIYDERADMPVDIRAGFNHRLRGLPVLFNMNFHHLGDEYDSFFERFENIAIGGEIFIGKYVRARVGFDNAIRKMASPSSDKKFSGFSFGLGLELDKLHVDYALQKVGTAIDMHRVSINFSL